MEIQNRTLEVVATTSNVSINDSSKSMAHIYAFIVAPKLIIQERFRVVLMENGIEVSAARTYEDVQIELTRLNAEDHFGIDEAPKRYVVVLAPGVDDIQKETLNRLSEIHRIRLISCKANEVIKTLQDLG